MIHFSLRCAKDHEFEAWFQSSEAFEQQLAGKQVNCPSCGGHDVEKAPMAPAVTAMSRRPDPDAVKLRRALTELREKVEKNCDYVGKEFPDEARKIHYGEAEARGIYGEATPEQASELVEEGVDVAPLPWLRRADS
ncbi:MAG: DUF1178 family protein [Alphaproteobacteria bacterium]